MLIESNVHLKKGIIKKSSEAGSKVWSYRIIISLLMKDKPEINKSLLSSSLEEELKASKALK